MACGTEQLESGVTEADVMTAEHPQDTASVADIVRDAAAHRRALRIVGRGSWLGAGRPVVAPHSVRLDQLAGIVEYEPGDLTLTARAGTSLADIARITSAQFQWLALDPFGDPEGTLGATVATASSGPVAHSMGGPRDNVLGVEIVTGDGAVVRGGGRVVKNVAGFDIARLVTGAWGTLGIITEVTVRLRATPEVDRTLALQAESRAPGLDAFIAGIAAAPVAPLALELLDETLAARLGAGDGKAPVCLVRLAGNAAAVEAQTRALASLGDVRQCEGVIWDQLRNSEPPDADMVVRIANLPSRFLQSWTSACELARSLGTTHVHGSPGRGVVRCVVARASPDDLSRACASGALGGTRVFERLPATLWPMLAPGPTRDRISRGVRLAFDPHGVLNPGIFGEGATV